MALIWGHNPDRYVTADLPRFWDAAHADATVTESGYNSTPGLSASSVNGYVRRLPRGFAGDTRFAVGGRFKASSLPAARKVILAVIDYNQALQCSVSLETDGTLTVWRGDAGTELAASSAVAISAGTWYKLGLQGVLSKVAGTCEVHLNGAVVDGTRISGVNTQHSDVNGWHGVHVGLSSDCIWGHLYAVDGAGALADLLPGFYVQTLGPSANGTHVDWTPVGAGALYQCVDDTDPNDDTDYIRAANVVGERFSLQMSTLAATRAVYGVMQTTMARNLVDSGMSASHELLVVIDGADYLDSWQSCTTDDWRVLQRLLTTNPRTGLPWTVADINAARYGGRLQA